LINPAPALVSAAITQNETPKGENPPQAPARAKSRRIPAIGFVDDLSSALPPWSFFFDIFAARRKMAARSIAGPPEWVDRFYFLSAYFTGLCALLLIGYSILGDKTITPQTRERRGWDLSRPERIDPRTIGR
jgi:hypothetical protein